RWRLWPGTLGPCKAWPFGHRVRRLGLDKSQRPGPRSTMRSTARRGWIAHFHPLVFQKRPCKAIGTNLMLGTGTATIEITSISLAVAPQIRISFPKWGLCGFVRCAASRAEYRPLKVGGRKQSLGGHPKIKPNAVHRTAWIPSEPSRKFQSV